MFSTQQIVMKVEGWSRTGVYGNNRASRGSGKEQQHIYWNIYRRRYISTTFKGRIKDTKRHIFDCTNEKNPRRWTGF